MKEEKKKKETPILHYILYRKRNLPFTLNDVYSYLDTPPSHVFEFIKEKDYKKLRDKTKLHIEEIVKDWYVKEDKKLIYYQIGTEKEPASGAGRLIGTAIKEYDKEILNIKTNYFSSISGI